MPRTTEEDAWIPDIDDLHRLLFEVMVGRLRCSHTHLGKWAFRGIRPGGVHLVFDGQNGRAYVFDWDANSRRWVNRMEAMAAIVGLLEQAE